MMHYRKTRLASRWLYLLPVVLWLAFPAHADPALMHIAVSSPGPRNISYLPVDLIPHIGADRAEGVQVDLLPAGGGAIAVRELTSRNADFAVVGMPAQLSARAAGSNIVAIAAVDDAPLFVLMVREGLKGKVKTIADLKGKVVGVNTSTLSSKSTSQQLLELMLAAHKVPVKAVRIVAAGQSWDEQSSLIRGGAVDAIMGDEPFASRLLAEKQAFFLANLGEPAWAPQFAGARFLHAALATRGDIIEREPDKVAKMVKVMRRSLQWIARHTPVELVDKLGVREPAERAALLLCLRKYKKLFNPDGHFSRRQLQETEDFFRAASSDNGAALGLRIESMVNDQWVGMRP